MATITFDPGSIKDIFGVPYDAVDAVWVSFAGSPGGLTEQINGTSDIVAGGMVISDAGITPGAKTVIVDPTGNDLDTYVNTAV